MKQLNNKIKLISASVVMAMALSACGGGSSDSNSATTIPTSPTNPTNPAQIECVNGIPKNLTTTGSGLFNQEVFSLESETNDQDEATIVFYSNKLINGVSYQNLTNFIKNAPTKIDTQYLSTYRLTQSKLDTSFKQTLTSSGFPQAYVISQDANDITLNAFTDDCTIQTENQVKLHFKQIDISGKTVADLFKYYEYPQIGKPERYMSSDIIYQLEIIKSKSLDKLLQDQTKFPAGSMISYTDQNVSPAPFISFRDANLTNLKTLDEFKTKTNTKLPVGYIWKDNQFAGYNVVYPVSATTGISYPFTENYSAVALNGKIYEANYFPEGDLLQQQKHPEDIDDQIGEFFFNKTAMITFAEAINKVL